jgi:ribosomal RNA-processing protein 1
MSTLFSPLLDALSRASPSIDDDRPAKRQKGEPVFAHLIMGCCLRDSGSEARATPDELRRGVLKAMFDAAADEKAVDSNRRRIYKLWREEADDE